MTNVIASDTGTHASDTGTLRNHGKTYGHTSGRLGCLRTTEDIQTDIRTSERTSDIESCAS